MSALFKNSKMIAVLFLFIVGIIIYRLFSATDPIQTNTAAEVGSDLLKLSEELTRAQLSQTVFSETAYRALTDFTVPVPQDNLGRTNPFGEIGRE